MSHLITRVATCQLVRYFRFPAICVKVRHVSPLDDEDGEVPNRVLELRKSLPRPAERTKKSSEDYPTQEEFGALVGVDRFRVLAWESGSTPNVSYRAKLAEISGGRFAPDDFKATGASAAEVRRRLSRVERRLGEVVAAVAQQRHDFDEFVEGMTERLAALEAGREQTSP